jgi:RNA polymerase sigma-70 factor (ECF subfamily)
MTVVRPLVLRYCNPRVRGSWVTGEDVAQEVCLGVLAALPSYRGHRPFLAFVYGIAAHRVADVYRLAARRPAVSVAEVPDAPTTDAGPEERALQHELSALLARLLGSLSAQQRQVVQLRVVDGLTAEETADAVASTPGAVRVAQHRALQRLRAVAS